MPSTASPAAFITYRGTSPKPTDRSWQTTSCGIRLQNSPCDLRARQEKDCACCAEWFLCHRQELLAVFLWYYFQRGWRRELVSSSLAHILVGPGNRQIPASWKALMSITHIFSIIVIIEKIVTILRIVVCFQQWYKCAFEGLGSSVSDCRCWEQKQNPSIPDSIWQYPRVTYPRQYPRVMRGCSASLAAGMEDLQLPQTRRRAFDAGRLWYDLHLRAKAAVREPENQAATRTRTQVKMLC